MVFVLHLYCICICIVLYCIVLYCICICICIVFYLYCIVLYVCIVLYCIALYCIVLICICICIVLHCIVLYWYCICICIVLYLYCMYVCIVKNQRCAPVTNIVALHVSALDQHIGLEPTVKTTDWQCNNTACATKVCYNSSQRQQINRLIQQQPQTFHGSGALPVPSMIILSLNRADCRP